MRLKSLYVKDFRSIDGELNVSLDAPIVLIHGPNGAGKTSMLSALELALTGAVPSLSRAEPDYLAYLPHKDRSHGEVRLEVATPDGSVRTAELTVTSAGISGDPMLGVEEAGFFSERSYLAQSTLGRLLEIYQHSEKKSDTPLTRFVKELLGLDRMEALISGLHTAGNIARLKSPVPAYGAVRDDIASVERDIAALDVQSSQLSSRIEGLETSTRARVEEVDPALLAQPNIEALQRALIERSFDQELKDLLVAKRELLVAEEGVAQAGIRTGEDRSAIEQSSRSAQSELDGWLAQQAERAEATLEQAGRLFADVSLATEASYMARARSLAARIQPDLERIEGLLSRHTAAEELRSDLTRDLDEARTRLARLDDQLSTAADANEAMARALSDLSTHIEGEACPVCDRDFSEVSDTPLATHLAAKVGAMLEQAGRLQALARDRSTTASTIADLERRQASALAELMNDADLSTLKSRAADLAETLGRLREFLPIMQVGDQLRERAAEAARTALGLRSSDQSLLVLRRGIEELARRFGSTFDEGTSIERLLQGIRSAIERRERFLTARQDAMRAASGAVGELIAAYRDRASLQERARVADSKLGLLQQRKSSADAILEVARDLLRRTREARGRVVRRVFNDELNAVWRDLFVRLAPEEPFIPAFAIPDATGSDIEAFLETHHRRGGKGGNPRAMLSAGNLNTAALTLFLALHLSVKPKLPWLVIDDPVQSMDEVHIAQFAALLRTLSRQMHRQVVVAVHERSLFDYLCLELSPSFEGDRLNVIELGRNAMGRTTHRWDPRLFVKDRAIAA